MTRSGEGATTSGQLRGAGALSGRDFLSSSDLSPDETRLALETAAALKRMGSSFEPPLSRGVVALYFEKQSLRTRVTFEAAIVQLGAHPTYLTPADAGFGTRESVPDAGRNLSRWVMAVVGRTFSHALLQQLAGAASVPVINALSDWEHPCQALADFQTIQERCAGVTGFPIAWVGDGNNVCNSLILMAASLGVHLRVASPAGYEVNSSIVDAARRTGRETGAVLELFTDPVVAVREARVVYTDVWTSMGQEAEKEKRLNDFKGFQINEGLLRRASADCIVLHCLPAHRGEEITDDVLDGPRSAVLDQAENRLHAQKAILAMLLG